ncbi:TetR/AcrR family transcriptional regulator C-terminal domain-containing protein [Tumebacillus sp. ITR2]|uniref:TetR/AcrR family transcriptional regulator C-terminal domain-containing protein n=1 Tax=Tumebacillus amylolyticus TaxID=2801339 RepID=A0ABS1JB00_9BACL|nr:TetR/AcrR family transcriptional regulator C-terminal domain-containing protein [Tumebacillus amylolyticus]MBL0387451.1 TetR/AcrR family transcriptional regulator C-terminal domain-containing protein [Tumebacillus amylolyticus]
MNKPTDPTRTIVSRRSRPAKEPLSREQIVKTALDLLKQEGTPGMSMRKIAKALDTGPSSLYVYVANLQELSAAVLDEGLCEVVLPEAQKDSWKKPLIDALLSYAKVLYESPGLAELSLSTIPIGPNSLALSEYLLQRLHEGGITSTQAAWGVDLLLFYGASVAFEQASRNQQGTTLQAAQTFYQSLDAKRYPMLVGVQAEMFSGGPERFRWGLEVILQGMLQTDTRS